MKTSLLSLALCSALPSAASAADAEAATSPWYAEAAYAGAGSGNLAFGYQFRPWFGLEAGYRRSDDGKHIGWAVPRRLDDSDGFEVSMRASIEVSPRFTLTGRFGVYDWNGEDLILFHGDTMFNTVDRDGVSPILGAGMRVKLTEHFALTGEYTLSDAFERTSGPEQVLSAGLRASF